MKKGGLTGGSRVNGERNIKHQNSNIREGPISKGRNLTAENTKIVKLKQKSFSCALRALCGYSN
jgi:hypothetical protein